VVSVIRIQIPNAVEKVTLVQRSQDTGYLVVMSEKQLPLFKWMPLREQILQRVQVFDSQGTPVKQLPDTVPLLKSKTNHSTRYFLGIEPFQPSYFNSINLAVYDRGKDEATKIATLHIPYLLTKEPRPGEILKGVDTAVKITGIDWRDFFVTVVKPRRKHLFYKIHGDSKKWQLISRNTFRKVTILKTEPRTKTLFPHVHNVIAFKGWTGNKRNLVFSTLEGRHVYKSWKSDDLDWLLTEHGVGVEEECRGADLYCHKEAEGLLGDYQKMVQWAVSSRYTSNKNTKGYWRDDYLNTKVNIRILSPESKEPRKEVKVKSSEVSESLQHCRDGLFWKDALYLLKTKLDEPGKSFIVNLLKVSMNGKVETVLSQKFDGSANFAFDPMTLRDGKFYVQVDWYKNFDSDFIRRSETQAILVLDPVNKKADLINLPKKAVPDLGTILNADSATTVILKKEGIVKSQDLPLAIFDLQSRKIINQSKLVLAPGVRYGFKNMDDIN